MRNIKDYLHLYLGCEVIYTPQNVIGVLEMVNIPADEVSVSTVKSCYPLIKNIKLILRPLSDMTEEEGIEVCKFIVVEKRQNQIDLQELTSSHIWYMDGEMWYGDGVSEVYDKYIKFNELSADQFRYMLSKGFDLFGLIDAGLAIDKTKQP